ncbi:MAG: DNA-processing protein DprA [Phycisphaerales bacterium]|nr:DNA-processing protein DprA [Phycisphaerales bacterium]
METISPIARKYLRLHLCYGVGAVRFSHLLRELGDINRVLGASVSQLSSVRQIGRKSAESIVRERDRIDVDRELELARRCRVRILCLADEDYPVALKMINDPPPCLYVRGTLRPTDTVALAIVGSRHCSRYGAEQAERFGALAANAGLTIVSGMARGIDSSAHRGALSTDGRTLAVLGCGLCHLYPPESTDLAEQISSHGALVSELPMDVGPDSKNFPPRNRIIAGLALGVLVIEAARRSGALISARLANEYNREVFAVPGQIDAPQAEGCHDLIKMGGAKLVTQLNDILDELGDTGAVLMSEPDSTEKAAEPQSPVSLTGLEKQIFETLNAEPMSAEAVCEASGLVPAEVARTLTGLQLKGIIRRVRGDLFERAR